MEKQVTKRISLNEEDILNLQNARDRIFQTLDYGGNNHYEALEIFTLDAIIKRFREEERREMKQLVRFENLTAKEILALSEEEIESKLMLEKSISLLNQNLTQSMLLIQFTKEAIKRKKNEHNQTL